MAGTLKGVSVSRPALLSAIFAAAALLTSGCASAPIHGALVDRAAQGSAGQAAGPIDAMAKAKTDLEEPAFGARVVAAHTGLLAGQDWQVTGGHWTPGTDVTIVLRGAAGDEPGTAQTVRIDDQGRYTTALSVPAGTPGGPHTIAATNLADPTDTATAEVTILGG